MESPVVILGDKSGSMDIAIRTSSIIAGILAVVTSAKLIFFDDKCMDAPYVPISVQEVINLAMEVKAGGGTCPAAALLPFYDRKEVVKTFVIVTDEEEAESESSTNLKQVLHRILFNDLRKLIFKILGFQINIMRA